MYISMLHFKKFYPCGSDLFGYTQNRIILPAQNGLFYPSRLPRTILSCTPAPCTGVTLPGHNASWERLFPGPSCIDVDVDVSSPDGPHVGPMNHALKVFLIPFHPTSKHTKRKLCEFLLSGALNVLYHIDTWDPMTSETLVYISHARCFFINMIRGMF